MQAEIEQMQFEKEQRESDLIKSIPQKSKIDDLNTEISDLREQLEEKTHLGVQEVAQIKQSKMESDMQLKSI